MCSIPVRCTLKFRLPGFWPSPVAMNVCRWTSAVISMSHASKSLCWAGTCTDNQPPSMYLKALILFLLWYCNRLQAHTRTQAHQPPKRQWKGGGEGEGTRTVSHNKQGRKQEGKQQRQTTGKGSTQHAGSGGKDGRSNPTLARRRATAQSRTNKRHQKTSSETTKGRGVSQAMLPASLDPLGELESRRRRTKGSVVGEEWCQNAAPLRWYTKNVFAQSKMILSRAWLHDTVSCAAWNDARKGVYLNPLF